MIKFSLDKKQRQYNEAGRPWYDKREGIAQSLKSLEALNKLVRLRHTAGYDFGKQLNEFYILGRYWLDTCGNCSKADGKVPKVFWPDIPDVLSSDELWAFIKGKTGKAELMMSFAMNGGNLPRPGLRCVQCGQTWEIGNCHDTVVRHKTEAIRLEEFVGKTLGGVKKYFAGLNSAIYMMQPDLLIRNDKHIDLTPDPEYPSLKKNQHGWLRERDGIGDDYLIQPGDDGFFNVWEYFHSVCNRQNLHDSKERRFKELFEKAGFKDIGMSAIPNEYCGCEQCAPWFNANTEYGTIKIGWRKRVINIDWEAMMKRSKARGEIPGKSFLPLFAGEDVTKSSTFIHAWGWEKAQEYLARIHAHLTVI